jgi:hypothetical protein
MMIDKIQINFNSFFKRTWGQRGTSYLFFYLFPMLTISRTAKQEYFTLHLGWLFWNVNITYLRYDNKRRIPK